MNETALYAEGERRTQTTPAYRGKERRSHGRANIGEERALVQRAIRHDREAFAQLYDRFVEKIFRYIYYKVGTRAEAEDLTAQVFMKAWEAIGHYQWMDRPFAAWLYRIAHNNVVDYFRMRRDVSSLDEMPFIEEENAASLEELTQQHMTADVLRRAISRLTQDQQRVIILRFLEGYSTEQVAQILDKQPGAVRTLQHRALAGLSNIFRKGSERL
jgi:RNA polymerase sigma-70 factor (ECF subfamily)